MRSNFARILQTLLLPPSTAKNLHAMLLATKKATTFYFLFYFYTGNTLSQCNLLHHKSRELPWFRIRAFEKLTSNHINFGTATVAFCVKNRRLEKNCDFSLAAVCDTAIDVRLHPTKWLITTSKAWAPKYKHSCLLKWYSPSLNLLIPGGSRQMASRTGRKSKVNKFSWFWSQTQSLVDTICLENAQEILHQNIRTSDTDVI